MSGRIETIVELKKAIENMYRLDGSLYSHEKISELIDEFEASVEDRMNEISTSPILDKTRVAELRRLLGEELP